MAAGRAALDIALGNEVRWQTEPSHVRGTPVGFEHWKGTELDIEFGRAV